MASTSFNLKYIKSTINPHFYDLVNVKKRFLIERGGRGSGKSYGIVQKLLLRILYADQNGVKHRFLCLRKTNPAVRDSVFSLLKYYIYEWHLEKLCTINRTNMSIFFKNGCEIHCNGLDEPEKLKSIHGITSIWMEEATEFNLNDFIALDMIMRGAFDDYYQIILSFNPKSKTNWIWKYFFDEDSPDREEIVSQTYYDHSTYKDNIFLKDPAYIKRLESFIKTSVYHHKVYLLGEWGVLSGLIYKDWELVDKMPNGVKLYGCDFGFNVPTSITEIFKKKDDIYLNEMLYQRDMTNAQLIKWIKGHMKPSNMIVCDSAEPNRIKEMQNAGIKAIKCRKGDGSVFDGIDYIQRHNLKITKSSTNIINEVSGYQWKMNKSNEPMDKPLEIDDHSMDSFRYPVWTKYGYGEQKLQIIFV